MKKKSTTLNVYMNGIHLGALTKSANGAMGFSYENTWLARTDARPISLSLPLQAKPILGSAAFDFFDNLLPDNDRLRARIQAHFKIDSAHPFDLLRAIGHDCVGAIQLIVGDPIPDTSNIQGKILDTKSIAKMLRSYQDFPLGMHADYEDFRISIAGAQYKTALLCHEGKWQMPLGQTPTTHIFKLPIGMITHQNIDLRDSCENEWLCAKIAAAFGFEVAACEIGHFEDSKALIVERFDRKYIKNNTRIVRLPQEDMCQALGISSHLKYQSDGGPGIENIMKLLQGSRLAHRDRESFFRAQILFWLLAATDGHAKNFSIFIEAGGDYRLTPLYDIISTYPLIAKKQLQAQKIKMAMALRSSKNYYRWHYLQRQYLLTTANKAGYSSMRAAALLDEMNAQIDNVIDIVSAQLTPDIPSEIYLPIFQGMRETGALLSREI